MHLEREKIRARLEKRKRAAIICANPHYRRVDDVVEEMDVRVREQDATIIDIADSDDSDDSQATMPYPESRPPTITQTADPIPVASPVKMPNPRHTITPKVHEVPEPVRQLWNTVMTDLIRNGNLKLDHGMCVNGKCIYCRGGPSRQLYSLMERMIQLQNFLWREPDVQD